VHRAESWISHPSFMKVRTQLFRVRFEPDFGIRIHGKATALHLWNTKFPKLAPNTTYAALALVAQSLQHQDGNPDDIGVLSLREPPTAYLLEDRASVVS
jgi:hypothetical protein